MGIMKSDAEFDAKSGVGQPRLEMGCFIKTFDSKMVTFLRAEFF